jgi:hypothetical protein
MTKTRGVFIALIALTLVAAPVLAGTTGAAPDFGAAYAATLASGPPGLVLNQSNSPNSCDAPNDPTTDRCGFQPSPGTPYVHVDDDGNWTNVSAEENDGPFDDNDNDDNDNDVDDDDNDNDDDDDD